MAVGKQEITAFPIPRLEYKPHHKAHNPVALQLLRGHISKRLVKQRSVMQWPVHI